MRKPVCVLVTLVMMTVAGISADETVSVIDSQCAKLPAPCNLLCQEAVSAESRALTLETAADQANRVAEEAKNKAVYYENMLKQVTIEVHRPNKSQSDESDTEWFWKTTDSLLRLLVPPHARNTQRSKYKPAQGLALQLKAKMPNGEEVNVGDIMQKAGEARLKVERTQKAAEAAKSTAETARASADEARRNYESCLCR